LWIAASLAIVVAPILVMTWPETPQVVLQDKKDAVAVAPAGQAERKENSIEVRAIPDSSLPTIPAAETGLVQAELDAASSDEKNAPAISFVDQPLEVARMAQAVRSARVDYVISVSNSDASRFVVALGQRQQQPVRAEANPSAAVVDVSPSVPGDTADVALEFEMSTDQFQEMIEQLRSLDGQIQVEPAAAILAQTADPAVRNLYFAINANESRPSLVSEKAELSRTADPAAETDLYINLEGTFPRNELRNDIPDNTGHGNLAIDAPRRRELMSREQRIRIAPTGQERSATTRVLFRIRRDASSNP
jgi:hypothetical protein